MRVLLIMVCLLSVSSAFAMGENKTHTDGSYCNEKGKVPSVSTSATDSKSVAEGMRVYLGGHLIINKH